MRTLALTYYSIKRVTRHRPPLVALVALPLVMAVVRAAVPTSDWSGPIACAILTAAVFYAQHLADDASGLMTGIRSAPVPEWSPAVSRVIAGAIILGAQMVVFGILIALIVRS